MCVKQSLYVSEQVTGLEKARKNGNDSFLAKYA